MESLAEGGRNRQRALLPTLIAKNEKPLRLAEFSGARFQPRR
jgi:hypothetical protein